jgi:putative membrane protein
MKKTTKNWLLAIMAAGLCLGSTGLRADDKDKDDKQSSGQSTQSSSDQSDTTQSTTEQSASEPSATTSEAAGAEAKDKNSADRKFAEEAAKAGIAEVKMGELAQQKAQSQSVKDYGQRLMNDHQAANEKLKEICEQKHGKSDEAKTKSTDLGEHQKAIDHLSSLSGEEFDKAFIDHAVMDHQKCIKKFEKQANEGEDPAIRSFARETLPTLQEHLKIAQMLKDNPNASLPSANEPAGAERKSDVPNQGQEQKDQQQDQDQKDQNQGQSDGSQKP